MKFTADYQACESRRSAATKTANRCERSKVQEADDRVA
jgi:hypothetical protein